MSPQSGLRRYALPGIATLTIAIGLVGATHLKAARPVSTMPGVPCPIDDTTTEQVSALHASGLTYLRAVKFAPVCPVPDGFVPDATTSEEARQWIHENCVARGGVKHGHSYLHRRGIEANKLGLTGPPINEPWFSFGPNGYLVGVGIYRRGMSANDTTTVWDGTRHTLRDMLGVSMSTTGDAPPVVLGASSLQTTCLQRRSSNYVAVVTASNLPYTELAVQEQYMPPRL